MYVSVYLQFNKKQSDAFTLLVNGEYEGGTDPEFETESIKLVNGDLTDLILMNLTIDEIVEKVYEHLG